MRCVRDSVVILLLLLATVASARAEDPNIKVQVSAPQFYVDSPLTVVVTVERSTGDVGDAPPVFDPTDEFIISEPTVMRGSGTTQSLVDGSLRRTQRYYASYQFQMRATREGQLTIPSASIVLDGQQYRTNPEHVSAIKPATADFATLRVEPDHVVAYVGQAVRLSINFESSQIPRGTGAFIGDTLPRGVVAMPGKQQPIANGEAVNVPIFGIEGYAFLSRDSTGTGTAFTMPLCMIAETPGTRTLGPISFVITDDPRWPREKYSVNATPVTLDVRPLPEQGRGEAFNGIVGACTIDAAISSPSAMVGDPLTLTVRIRGDVPPGRLPAPRLDLQGDIAGSFRLAPEGWIDGGVSGDAHTYSMTIRPLRADISELPPIEIHWFDPEASTYRVSKSRALPMKIESSREVTAADAIGRRPPTIARDSLADSPLRLYANTGGTGRLTDRSLDFASAWDSPWRSIVLIAPPVAWSVLAGLGAWIRTRDPRVVHRNRLTRRAIAMARRARRRPELAGVAARCFVAAHAGLNPESITSADGESLMEGMDSPHAATVLDALRSEEAVAYHGNSVEASQGLVGAIRNLGRQLRGRRGGGA